MVKTNLISGITKKADSLIKSTTGNSPMLLRSNVMEDVRNTIVEYAKELELPITESFESEANTVLLRLSDLLVTTDELKSNVPSLTDNQVYLFLIDFATHLTLHRIENNLDNDLVVYKEYVPVYTEQRMKYLLQLLGNVGMNNRSLVPSVLLERSENLLNNRGSKVTTYPKLITLYKNLLGTVVLGYSFEDTPNLNNAEPSKLQAVKVIEVSLAYKSTDANVLCADCATTEYFKNGSNLEVVEVPNEQHNHEGGVLYCSGCGTLLK